MRPHDNGPGISTLFQAAQILPNGAGYFRCEDSSIANMASMQPHYCAKMPMTSSNFLNYLQSKALILIHWSVPRIYKIQPNSYRDFCQPLDRRLSQYRNPTSVFYARDTWTTLHYVVSKVFRKITKFQCWGSLKRTWLNWPEWPDYSNDLPCITAA